MEQKVELVGEGQAADGTKAQRRINPEGQDSRCQLCSALGGRVRIEMASNLIGTKEASNSAKCWGATCANLTKPVGPKGRLVA